jgi:thymidylate synthase (FAD)
MDELTEQIHKLYSKAIELGAAREVSRFYLPVGTYTMLYWKMDLHNLLHFLRLRMALDAQYEVRVYAQAMYQLISPLVPNVISAFEDTYNKSVTITPQEAKFLSTHLSVTDDVIDRDFKGTERRKQQFKKKIEQLNNC